MVKVDLNDRKVPLTPFTECKAYGRVVLRRNGESIGAGIVTALE